MPFQDLPWLTASKLIHDQSLHHKVDHDLTELTLYWVSVIINHQLYIESVKKTKNLRQISSKLPIVIS